MFTHKFLENGIILRHLDSFGLPEAVRVTIGKESDMKCFTHNLKTILEHA